MKKHATYGDYTISIAANNSVSVVYQGGYLTTLRQL